MENIQRKKEFIKILNSLDGSKHRQDNFRNFCELAYCSLAKTTALDETTAENFESRYMDIVGTYQNKDDVRKMPDLLGLMTLSLNERGCDFLGDIAAEIEALDKKNGQFFTPYHISKLMAQINLVDANITINEQGFISISDPTAGAGCMILAAADVLEDQGNIIQDCMSAHATEISRMTYHMLFIQLSMRGIPAGVIHGNSITLEIFESAYTPAAMNFIKKHGCLFRDIPEKKKPKFANSDFNIAPILNAQQLKLFG